MLNEWDLSELTWQADVTSRRDAIVRYKPNTRTIDLGTICEYNCNKAIRDSRPRPPRHQVGWDIPLHFDTNPESLRPFVPEIWPNNVFNLSATYDLDLWPKILKIFVSHGVPIRNMYAKFHNDRLRNGWDITLWNFAKTRTNTHTNTHTHKHTHTQTNRQTWALQYLALPLRGRGNKRFCRSLPHRELKPGCFLVGMSANRLWNMTWCRTSENKPVLDWVFRQILMDWSTIRMTA